jgi:hypothetical protein
VSWLRRKTPNVPAAAGAVPTASATASRASLPWLAQPWEGGVTAWIVVFGAVIAVLVGAAVTNNSSNSVALPVVLAPVVIAAAFALLQWWQVRSSRSEPASWWHLAGPAAALVTWLIFPTAPGVLGGVGDARGACAVLPTTDDAGCLRLATQAYGHHNLAWWLTGVAILACALLARRSRIAAWAAIPIAFAGCEIASHYLQALLTAYNAG